MVYKVSSTRGALISLSGFISPRAFPTPGTLTFQPLLLILFLLTVGLWACLLPTSPFFNPEPDIFLGAWAYNDKQNRLYFHEAYS